MEATQETIFPDILNFELDVIENNLRSLEQGNVPIDLNSFVQLCDIIAGRLLQKQNTENHTQISAIFKKAEKLLIEFSKTADSWEIAFLVLQQKPSSETEQRQFQAASILKNKIKMDFVTIKGDQQSSEHIDTLKNNMMLMIKSFCRNGQSKTVTQNVCLSLSYSLIQTHQQMGQTMIPWLIQNLQSGTHQGWIQEGKSLFKIIEYLASECEDDSIVIEETIRESFFDYIDTICDSVMADIFTPWSSKITARDMGECTPEDVDLLKINLIKAFTAWMTLRLPDHTLENLPSVNTPILQLVFNELSSEAPKTAWSETLLDCATDCVIQLLKVSQKKKGPTFQPLKSFIFLQVDSLAACVQKITDPEMGEQYQDIFVEIGKMNMNELIQGRPEDLAFLSILLQILEIGCSKIDDLRDLHYERVKGRYQAWFWREFIKKISEFGSEAYKLEKIKAFEGIFVRLIDAIIMQIEINPTETFEDFNYVKFDEEQFDFFYDAKEYLGKVIRDLIKLVGVKDISEMLMKKLQFTIDQAQQNQENPVAYTKIHAVFTASEQVCRLIDTQQDLMYVQPMIMLLFELPHSKYFAFRLISTEIIKDLTYVLKDPNEKGEYPIEETQKFMEFVAEGLKNEYTEYTSAKCFKKLCENTSHFLHPFTDVLMQSILPESMRDWKAVEAKNNIICSFGILIVRVCDQDPEKGTVQMRAIMKKLLEPVSEVVESIKQQQEKAGTLLKERQISELWLNQIQDYFDLISEFVRSLQPLQREAGSSSPFDQIFKELWPFVMNVMQLFPQIEKIQEPTTRLVKHSIRLVPALFQEYLMDFLRTVITQFSNHPCSAYIYCLEFCLKEYSKIEKFDQIFQEAINVLIQICGRFLNSKDQMTENAHIVDDFFQIQKQFLRQKYILFFQSDQLSTLTQLTLNGIGLHHEHAAQSHSSFIKELLRHLTGEFKQSLALIQCQNPEAVANDNRLLIVSFFQSQGGNILMQYVKELLETPPDYVIDTYIGVFLEICISFAAPNASDENLQNSKKWLIQCLQSIPNNIFTADEKTRLINKFDKCRSEREFYFLEEELDIIYTRAKNYNRR